MGCWNQTCAVTGLPITCGDEVVALFLIESRYKSTTTNCLYATPTPFYFEGKYNDYGAVEEEHGIALPFIVSAIRKHLVERPLGENEYHEKEITRDGLDFHKIMEEDHEGRLAMMQNILGKKTELAINHIEIHKFIVERIVENFKIGTWDRTIGGMKYRTFDDIMGEFNTWYEEQAASLNGSTLAGLGVPPTASLRRLMRSSNNGSGNTFFDRLFSDNNYDRTCPLMDAGVILDDMISAIECEEEENPEAWTRDDVYKMAENALILYAVDSLIAGSGRQWVRPGHIGQESDSGQQQLLASLIIEGAEKQEFDSWTINGCEDLGREEAEKILGET